MNSNRSGHGGRAAPGDSGAGALPDELSIPGLQPALPASGQWKQLAAGAFMVLSMAAVLGMIVWKRFGPQEAPAAAPLAVASDQLPPLRFESPPEPRAAALGSPAAPATSRASSPAGHFGNPAATQAAVQPVALQSPGIGPGATPGAFGNANTAMPVAGAAHAAVPVAAPAAYAQAPVQHRDESPFVSQLVTSPSGGAGSQRIAHATPHSGSPLGAAASNLEQYQAQLDGMVRQLQNLTDQAQGTGAGAGQMPAPNAVPLAVPPSPAPFQGPVNAPTPPRSPALFGQLERTATPRVHATMLGARSYVIPKGVLFQCALKTRVVSAVSGFVGCQVQRPVYSDDGKVVLIERGSHLDGEYRIVQVRPGVTRIPILWTRVRTPHGVTVDLDSPATGPLGDSGITGEVNNRWLERVGAALLLSLIDDAIKLQISENSSNPNATVVLPNTAAATSRLAEKVLDSTINIPPLITAHQGSVVGVYVSRDLDFSGVYRLEAR